MSRQPSANQELRAFNKALAKCRQVLLALCAISLFVNMLSLAVPFYLLQIIDAVIPTRSSDTLILLTVFFTAALLCYVALDTLRSAALARLGTWLDRSLSGMLLRGSISRAARRSRKTSNAGLRDLWTLRSFLGGSSVTVMLDLPWLPLFVAIIFLFSATLAWMTVAGAFILLGIAFVNDLATRRLAAEASDVSDGALDHAHAVMRNANVIEAMGMHGELVRRWNRRNDEALAAQARLGTRSSLIMGGAKFFRNFWQIAMIAVAAWLVINNQLTIGGMIASLLLMRRGLQPIDRAISSWRMVVAAWRAHNRIESRIGKGEEETGHKGFFDSAHTDLRVKTLSYAYPGSSSPVLSEVDFRLEGGEILGIAGPTAAGKSTLARLLLGNLRPTAGRVMLNGVSMQDWDRQALGRHIGYLPQDVELFEGTVRENIARMQDSDIHEVMAAAALARIDRLIARLPQGYDTPIGGEAGLVLSGGQRQLVGLARAVYGDVKLVVLDEPDANLDQDGRRALVEAMLDLKERGATVVLISHRTSILKHTDKALLLRRGRLEADSDLPARRDGDAADATLITKSSSHD